MLTAISRIRLAQVLSPDEVLTSSQLTARLRKVTGISEAYARQMLTRQAGEDGLWRSERLKLERNERLFAHGRYVGTPPFFSQAAALLERGRPGIARCLRRLAEEPALHRAHAVKLLAAPLSSNERARRPAAEAELGALGELGVAVHRSGTDFECLVGRANPSGRPADDLADEARLTLQTELLLARILGDYLRRMNLISWGRLQVGAAEPGYVTFNNQAFTAFGFNYLDPLAEWKVKGKPTGCPLLLDVLVGRCGLDDVASFRDRILKATHRGESRQRSLGVIAARDFEGAALKEARGRGLITVNFRQLFGEEALRALQTVSELLNLTGDTAARAELGVPGFASLLGELKANPVVVRIRSMALEAVAGLVLQERDGCHSIRLGLDVPFTDRATAVTTTRDVDVHGARGDRVWAVECKAYHEAKLVEFSEVKRFFDEVVPAFLSWHRENRGEVRECQAEFWTTGRFAEDCEGKLRDLLSARRPRQRVSARLLDGAALQREVPHSLGGQCKELLKAISLHDAPSDEE